MRPSNLPRVASEKALFHGRWAAIAIVALLAPFGARALGAAAGPALAAPVPAASSIGVIRKSHNLDIGGGMIGLELTVPTELVGVAGETVAVVVWFYDAAGQPIASALPGWGDASNQLRVISSDTSPVSARERVDFPVRVPYGAFPRRREGRYTVEARAVLVERVANGRVVLARRATTFFVE
jgi:hypothetical protein